MRTCLKNNIVAGIFGLAAFPVSAQSEGDWTVGVGIGQATTRSENGQILGRDIKIDDDVGLIFTIEYFPADNFGIEFFASSPFEHEASADGFGDLGTFKYVPAALTLNYHFPTENNWKPFVGGGLSYVSFFEEESDIGPLSFSDSFGITAQVGLDYKVSDSTALRFNVRWFDIDSDVRFDNESLADTEFDAYIIGLSYLFQF